jgi:hypothetical protein
MNDKRLITNSEELIIKKTKPFISVALVARNAKQSQISTLSIQKQGLPKKQTQKQAQPVVPDSDPGSSFTKRTQNCSTVTLGCYHSPQPEGMSKLLPFTIYLFTFCQNKAKYPYFQIINKVCPKSKPIYPVNPVKKSEFNSNYCGLPFLTFQGT